MYYVYILYDSKRDKFYVGYTNNIKRRTKEHMAKKSYSTKYGLYKLYCYFAFRNSCIAKNFEQYLKRGSGRSFSIRHFGVRKQNGD